MDASRSPTPGPWLSAAKSRATFVTRHAFESETVVSSCDSIDSWTTCELDARYSPAQPRALRRSENLLGSVQQAGGYSKRDMVKFMVHAFEASFLPRAAKDAYIESLEAFAADNP